MMSSLIISKSMEGPKCHCKKPVQEAAKTSKGPSGRKKGQQQNKSSSRRSVNISVRRSSRFMGRSDALGSVSSLAEYAETAKVKRYYAAAKGGGGGRNLSPPPTE